MPATCKEIKDLPGRERVRVRKALEALGENLPEGHLPQAMFHIPFPFAS
jgi:hypothetical protein